MKEDLMHVRVQVTRVQEMSVLVEATTEQKARNVAEAGVNAWWDIVEHGPLTREIKVLEVVGA